MLQEKLRKLRAAQILRSLANKSPFTTASSEVVRNSLSPLPPYLGSLFLDRPKRLFYGPKGFFFRLDGLLNNVPFTPGQARDIQKVSGLVKQHRRDFVQPGACSEAERDRIEEEIGTFLRTCNKNVELLESSIPSEQDAADGKTDLNLTTIAHRHGVVCTQTQTPLQLSWITVPPDLVAAPATVLPPGAQCLVVCAMLLFTGHFAALPGTCSQRKAAGSGPGV
jgi:hypothetical protein